MIPRILEYIDGRIRVTENAFLIPEVKAILDKYELKAEPYLAFVHLASSPDSPHINLPSDEKVESIYSDIATIYGPFDSEEELLQPAIDKLQAYYMTAIRKFVDELKDEMDRQRIYLRDNAVTSDDLKVRNDMLKNAGALVASLRKTQKEADEELKANLRGSAQVGMY